MRPSSLDKVSAIWMSAVSAAEDGDRLVYLEAISWTNRLTVANCGPGRPPDPWSFASCVIYNMDRNQFVVDLLLLLLLFSGPLVQCTCRVL